LDTLKIEIEQLPVISSSDPALEGQKTKSQDIIKVTRKSDTAGVSIYYRRVVDK